MIEKIDNVSTKKKIIYTLDQTKTTKRADYLAIEEPVEMGIEFGEPDNRQTQNIAITMRTPGDDEVLTIGFLLTEGIIQKYEDIKNIQLDELNNKVTVSLHPDCNFDTNKLSRHLFTSSSCGVCGKTSIDHLKTTIPYQLNTNEPLIKKEALYHLPEVLKANQQLFDQTGGIHATGLFTAQGEFVKLFEDVGRHNALDKLLGWALKAGKLPLSNSIILLSGRASFELIQKALMTGGAVVAAVGAPSSLAVELAEEYGMTLIGFLKPHQFNVYSGFDRFEKD